MAMVIRVRFKRAAKLYDFDPNGLDLHNGMSVVTETARGVEPVSYTHLRAHET